MSRINFSSLNNTVLLVVLLIIVGVGGFFAGVSFERYHGLRMYRSSGMGYMPYRGFRPFPRRRLPVATSSAQPNLGIY